MQDDFFPWQIKSELVLKSAALYYSTQLPHTNTIFTYIFTQSLSHPLSVFPRNLPDSVESTVAVQHTAVAAVVAGQQWSCKSRQWGCWPELAAEQVLMKPGTALPSHLLP